MPKISKADALRMALEGQADVSEYGEGTVEIVGPIDLEQVATTFLHLCKVAT